ncbi:peptidoglycan recognition protein [Pseudokineococcus basanitobsidens]|uniref:Peptidoglycan recognition protein n=1 Tax=Pseudokineococcus basanitobsidens TaxID=1926649 RepID=A0ABU8RL68_9ACTN
MTTTSHPSATARALRRLPLRGPVLVCAAAVTLPLVLVHPGAAGAAPAPAPAPAEAPVAAVEHGPVATSTTSVAVAGVDRAALSALGAVQAASAAGTADRPSPELLTAQVRTTSSFEVAGVTWAPTPGAGRVAVQVRLLEEDGWSRWEPLPVMDEGPDPGTAEAAAAADVVGTAPLVTNGAHGYQLRVDTSTGHAPEDVRLRLVDGGEGDVAAAERRTGARVAASSTLARSSAVPVPVAGAAVGAASSALQPAVVTRADWGADERLARGTTSRNKTVAAMVVHHTASSNGYSTPAQAQQQLRGIYTYHTQSLGWADIGYNFLVDKFGTVYEGRRGSITENVVGAHASGFNTSTMGVSALGNYAEASPSSAMVRSIAQVVAWKLGANGVSPTATTRLTSAGGSTTRFARGTTVTLDTVSGHRQTSFTECPGDLLFAQVPAIRTQAAALIAAAATAVPAPVPTPTPTVPVVTPTPTPTPTVPVVTPTPTPTVPVATPTPTPTVPVVTPTPTPRPTATPAPRPTPAPPVPARAQTLVGDWDGDGRDQVGLFVDGAVSLRRADGTVLRYRFGAAGDVAVVGDWDRDGKDSVGVFRRGTWLLKNRTSTGAADRTFFFGRAGDVPVTGRWDGRTEGIGVVRQGRWLLRTQASAGAVDVSLAFGRATDRPLPGDWDGNGTDTPGLQRGNQRFTLPSLRPGPASPVVFGTSTMVGFVADMDGDRRDGWGVRAPGTSTFLWRGDTRAGAATGTVVFTG